MLIAHPGIAEAAAVGRPDDKLGETVCAVIVPVEGTTLALPDIVAWLRDNQKAAIYKMPQHLVVVDKMPRSPAGKILKGTLRQMAQST